MSGLQIRHAGHIGNIRWIRCCVPQSLLRCVTVLPVGDLLSSGFTRAPQSYRDDSALTAFAVIVEFGFNCSACYTQHLVVQNDWMGSIQVICFTGLRVV